MRRKQAMEGTQQQLSVDLKEKATGETSKLSKVSFPEFCFSTCRNKVIKAVVQETMNILEKQELAVKLELLETLRTITEGKVVNLA